MRVDLELSGPAPLARVLDRRGVVVVAALVLASGVAGSSPLAAIAVAATAVMAALALALALRPGVGPALLVVAALVVPFELATGTGSGLNPVILLVPALLGSWALLRLTQPGEVALALPVRTLLPVAALGAVALVALLTAARHDLPVAPAPLRAQLGGLAVFLVSGAAYLLAAAVVRTRRDLSLLLWTFLATGAAFVAARSIWGGAVALPRGAEGSVFLTWLVALAAAQALGNRDLRPWVRLGLLCVATLVVWRYLGGATAWVSGWLPPLAALLVVCFLRAPKRTALAAAALALCVALPGPLRDWLDAATVERNLYSLDTRVAAARTLWEIIGIGPLLGSGPANYYWYARLYPIFGWYVPFSSHSQYLDLLAQTGAIGLAAFLWVVVESGRAVLRLRREAGDGLERAFADGALAALAGSLVAGLLGDWLLPFVYNVGLAGLRSSFLFWLLLGAAAGRASTVARR